MSASNGKHADSAVPGLHSEEMKLTIKHGATIADLEALPEGLNGQLIDGVLYVTSRPGMPHTVAITNLIVELGPFMKDRKRGWVIAFEPALKFGKNILVGDVSGWRRERMPVIPDDNPLELAPDWVCEGLSPSTARIDRGRKREIYAKAKVSHLWFLDPVHQTIEVLGLRGGGYQVLASAGGDERGRFPPFETVEIDLSIFWQR